MDDYFWVTTRTIKPGSREQFEQAWRPAEFPPGLVKAYVLYAEAGDEVVGISIWDSAEQREAIAQAINVEGRTGKDVAAAAANGTLKEGLEPFELPVSTAGEIARQQIERKDGEHNAGDTGGLTLAELAARGRALLDREFEALEAQKAGEVDLHRLQLALRAARELEGIEARLRPNGPGDSNGHKPRASGGQTLAERLEGNGATPAAAASG